MSSSLGAPMRLASWRSARSGVPARLRKTAGLSSVVAGCLMFAGGAQAATAPVNLGTDSSFSVLAGSTITNTGPTTMSDDLGLDPGSSVAGAPVTLGATHIDDGAASQAQVDLGTAITDAAGRPATPLLSADLSGQAFTPGVYSASSSLLFSAGAVTLNAQGDPNAVFIFQIPSAMTTGSATSVILSNGAQACNVFWEVGSSATLGSNSTFAGTVMAQMSITAGTGATLDGRLLANTGAVNLDSNTITTSACSSPSGTSTTAGTTTTTGGSTTSGGTGSTATGTNGSTTAGAKGSATAGSKGSTTNGAKSGGTASSTAATKALAAKRHRERLAAQRKARLARLARLRRLKLLERLHGHSPARTLKSPGGFTG